MDGEEQAHTDGLIVHLWMPGLWATTLNLILISEKNDTGHKLCSFMYISSKCFQPYIVFLFEGENGILITQITEK